MRRDRASPSPTPPKQPWTTLTCYLDLPLRTNGSWPCALQGLTLLAAGQWLRAFQEGREKSLNPVFIDAVHKLSWGWQGAEVGLGFLQHTSSRLPIAVFWAPAPCQSCFAGSLLGDLHWLECAWVDSWEEGMSMCSGQPGALPSLKLLLGPYILGEAALPILAHKTWSHLSGALVVSIRSHWASWSTAEVLSLSKL